jgi:hypothetical protein
MGSKYTLHFTKSKMESPWVSDRVVWVTTKHSGHELSIFLGMSGSGTKVHPCASGEGLTLLPYHTIYIQLWNQKVLQYVGINVTSNVCLGEKNVP